MKTSLISFFIIVLFFFGCRKDETTDISHTLRLLRNKWTPTSCRIYFPNGECFKLIPDISRTFTSDDKYKIESYTTTSTGTIIIEETIATYQLLQDDSTLLFYNKVDGVLSEKADTFFISSLTNNLLVYYSKKNNAMNSLDSLKR